MEIKDLGPVMEDLYKLERDWRRLGRALKIEENILDTFCPKENHKEKFINVLCTWMEQKAQDATLDSLHHALKAAQFAGLARKVINDPVIIGLLTPPG